MKYTQNNHGSAAAATAAGTCEIEAVDATLPKYRLRWINEAERSGVGTSSPIWGVLIYFLFPAHPLQKWQCLRIDFTLRDQSSFALTQRKFTAPPLPPSLPNLHIPIQWALGLLKWQEGLYDPPPPPPTLTPTYTHTKTHPLSEWKPDRS